MAINTLGGKTYARMILGGSKELDRNRQIVNDLNVFPIPDGDTGDNMFMTANGGSEALETDNENLAEVSRQVSQGMFMGARGNSGVILSRIFKGIFLGLSDVENTDTAGFLKALRSGVDESYKAVAQRLREQSSQFSDAQWKLQHHNTNQPSKNCSRFSTPQ